MRVKRGFSTHRRHKKYIKLAKGFRGARGNCYRPAREAVERALVYAYRDRKQKKRVFRSLWIQRIGAGAREHGLSYSRFMNGLSRAGISINRKMLADLAVREKESFAQLAQAAAAQLKAS